MPWSNGDIIHGCEIEVAEAMTQGKTKEKYKRESIMRLSWALVHSRRPQDVHRGIDMLQAAITSMAKSTTNSPLDQQEMNYLLAVGYCRSGAYSTSRWFLDRCLEVEPECDQALRLKKRVEDRIVKDGFIGIGIAAGVIAVGGIVGVLVTRLCRRP